MATTTPICDLPAATQAALIRQGEITAVEALDSALERVAAVDGIPGELDHQPTAADADGVHAFITVTAARARAQAEAIDRRRAAGETLPPLAGVPITVKDIFCLEGVPATAASRMLANFTPPYTATAVGRLEDAGAVTLGKVSLDEFTYGSSNESAAFQPSPRNPWDLSRVPGGSSGGSAAAVAAGEGALSLGTDTAGSIRQPAAFCGVVGVKPTYGRVSRYGLIAFGSSLDCPGPVARDITDAALMLGVMAGADRRDATAARVPVPDYTAHLEDSIRGMRIGLSPDYFRLTYPDPTSGEMRRQPLPAEIEAAVLHAADVLAAQGAEIVTDVPMPHNYLGIPVYFVISRVEAASNLHRFDGVKYGYRTPADVDSLTELYRRSRAEGFGLQPKLRILMGMYVSAAQYSEQYYNRALRARALIRRDFEQIFDPAGQYRLDALLTPTTPTPAFPIGDVYGDSVLMQYADQLTVAANHAGVPGVSLPGGLSAEGLPLGIQFLGPDYREDRILQLGRAFELATAAEPWRAVRPAALARLA